MERTGMQQPIVPFWFKQRQLNFEPAGGDNVLKITGPNIGEAFIRVDQAKDGQWQAALRQAVDGPDVAVVENIPGPREAWDAAFELYRENMVV
jgi:hypothetical protein